MCAPTALSLPSCTMPTEESNPGIDEVRAASIAARTRGKLQPVKAIRLVERLDNGNPYYLVVLGEDKKGSIVAIDKLNGNILASATTTKPYDGWLANQTVEARLVWMPCQISLSPLYPFWRVVNDAISYSDRSGRTWHYLLSSGPD